MKKTNFIRLLVLMMVLITSVNQVWGTDTYYYRGEKNSWGADEMTVSSDGYYAYYSTSGNHTFKISTSTTTWEYNYSYVKKGYNNTDVSNIGDWSSDNCYCWESGSHYILIYFPNTNVNGTSNPIICASTTLPSNSQYTVYYVNQNNWTAANVKAYLWTKTGDVTDEYSGWAGTAMTDAGKTYNGKKIYKINVYRNFANIIFSNNGADANKTNDLALGSTNKGKLFTHANCSTAWVTYTYDVKVTFNMQGHGSAVSSQTLLKGGKATTPSPAPSATGYTFGGWYKEAGCTNAWNFSTDVVNADTELFAKWTPKSCTVNFDFDEEDDGHGSHASATASVTATYDAAMPDVTPPTAADGYAFMGYYDAEDGGGNQYYKADGKSYQNWNKNTTSTTTLYAYWEKAEITTLTLDAATVEAGNTVGVTPTITPTPAGTTIVCWQVLYNDTGNPTGIDVTWNGTKATFTAPASNGVYKIVATLKTGDNCAAGDKIDESYTTVTVAGSHTVTVAYKHSSTTIKTSTSVTGRPTVWSSSITAPEIFGYTFDHWTAGDGITLSEDGTNALVDGSGDPINESDAGTIYIKASYDGTLTANYTPKSLIYFKNTLGWSSVYVNFYGEDGYWDDKGSGNKSVTNRNKAMTRIGETDVWYFDYGYNEGGSSITPTKWVAFTQDSQNGDGSGAQNFWASGTGEPVSYPARRADDLADKAGETGFYSATPMFVPLAGQTPVTLNEGGGGKALYYNSGYWTKYLPGTGYTLEFYDNGTGAFIKSVDFSSADELMPMKVTVDLEATTTYKFQIKRHGDVYLGNSGTMTYTNHGQDVAWEMTNTGFSQCHITTTASGDYTFNFTYSAYHNESTGKDEYRLRLSVDYPVSTGDYRLVYTDNTRSGRLKPSAIIPKENNGSAIASFFVRYNNSPVLRIQQASVANDGTITWNEYPTSGTQTNQIASTIASAITKDTVYNFNLSMDGSGNLSVSGVEYYSGNYYIRTDAANSKWDNYRTDMDHLMTYSEYSIAHGGYTHYYTHWVDAGVTGRKNVKFVIANDYSPCISDTLERETASGAWAHIDDWMAEGGDLKRSANVRFMWNIATNAVSRAYVDGAQDDGSEFLLLLSSDSKIKQGETTKTQVTFNDNGNWIYETNIKAQPGAQIKLRSTWGNTANAIVQYFKGSSSESVELVGGSGDTWYDFRLIYDFKTNRLVTSYVPVTGTISTDIAINADVMFIREHQGDIAQLTFSGSGAISKITTAYGVMRFNKWTLNNKDKSTHNPLATELSRYERDLFYISFPFRVNLEEVFGFGTYGTHWIIEEYDGQGRADNGFWSDSESYWKFITNRKGKFLEPKTGYILALDLDELGEGSSVWANTDQVELYFPSYGTMPTITSSSVTYEVPAHTCSIAPRPGMKDDRRIKDSHWNILSVPTYINSDDVSYVNTDWTSTVGPKFLYVWNKSDNTLTATDVDGYTYKAMHAYMVQYYGNVTWTTSVSPAAAVAARLADTQDMEYKLVLQSDERMEDQTFVRLTDDENVSTGFEFNYDLSKEMNRNRANIYTLISTMIDSVPSITEAAANVQPKPLTTTIIPVGVKIAAAGDYTFSMPDGTNGGDVWIIDNVTGSRINLGLMDYTVNLSTGTYDGRFSLEFPIQNVVTDIENDGLNRADALNDANDDVRKVFVGGRLYIIRDGKAYDATGAQVR